MSVDGFPGQWDPTAGSSEFNAIQFMIAMRLARVSTATLVRVAKVTVPTQPGLTGVVDVQPLVNMLDGSGQSSAHGVLHGLPYVRLQGGPNAVIVDPAVDDIGLAVFADRDISSVLASRTIANPGSRRRFDMADGVYLGGVLCGVPTQYLQFLAGGLSLVDANGNTIVTTSGGIDLTPKGGQDVTVHGPEHVTGTLGVDGDASFGANVGVAGTLSAAIAAFSASFAVAGGATIKRMVIGTVTTPLNSMGTGTNFVFTGTVTGAQVGDFVVLGPPGQQDAFLIVQAYVSAANTVTIILSNPFAGTRTAVAMIYNVLVIGVT